MTKRASWPKGCCNGRVCWGQLPAEGSKGTGRVETEGGGGLEGQLHRSPEMKGGEIKDT